jgi:cellulose synthase/poly-beta-1,6-N-acetylglucosamine synthase-like glycosyltransferase
MTAGLTYYLLLYTDFVIIYFFCITSIYLILNIVSFRRIRRYQKKVKYEELNKIFRLTEHKSISLIIPAYNEEVGIVDNLKSLLHLEYPNYQLIVVNDGSTDNTLKLLFEKFSLRQISFAPYYQIKCKTIKAVYRSSVNPSLIVVDKANGGKADAINAGINISKHSLITVIDADSILERDSLLKIVRPFVEDENVVAVGGSIRIANGCRINHGHIEEVRLSKSWLARFQVVEYLRAFLFGRNGFDGINGIMIVSGAFSCFSREALINIGGYKAGSIGEDMEIIVRMHKEFRPVNPKSRITFIPDPVCWTEAPENLKLLKKQRIRWQKGTFESVLLHKKLFFNLKYEWLGFLVFPYFTIFELIGPIIEVTGYVVFIICLSLGIINTETAVLFLLVAVLYGIVLSLLAVVLEEISFKRYNNIKDLIILFAAAILENFGYRQMTAVWRFMGVVEYLFGKKAWGHMERKGIENPAKGRI